MLTWTQVLKVQYNPRYVSYAFASFRTWQRGKRMRFHGESLVRLYPRWTKESNLFSRKIVQTWRKCLGWIHI